ncbi:hypothetical protein [Legionella sp. W05-934-2]|uniref:hypothetical protein n=1 Tax=Legionella sp. W05-934-2 TaxID=1198649 RepID=UPI003461DA3E
MKQLLSILFMLVSLPLMATQTAAPVPDLAFETLKYCYETEKKRQTELIKCMVSRLKSLPNPDGYHVQVIEDSDSKEHPNKLTFIIYNKFGQKLHCEGEATDIITINHCQLTEGKSLTPAEQLSITPPK